MHVSDIRNNQSWWIQEEKHKSVKKEQLEKQKFMEVEMKLTSQKVQWKKGWRPGSQLQLCLCLELELSTSTSISPAPQWADRNFLGASDFQAERERERERSFGEMILYSWNPSLWHHYYMLWSVSGPNSTTTSWGGEMHFEKTIMKNPEKMKLT